MARLKALGGVERAVYFHSRERRKSLHGVPELHRTHRFAIPTTPINNLSFPNRDQSVTFRTSVKITAADPTGIIFELGDATTAIAAWIDNGKLSLRAGDAAAADRGLAEFDNAADLPIGRKFDLVFSVRPGDGSVRIWGSGGEELARGVATGGQLPNGWAAASDGAFAAAATGALPADVTQTGAPTNFDVVEPLEVYFGQEPRHFV